LVSVLLTEVLHMVRAALAALLATEDDIEVIAEVQHIGHLVPTALRERPDVVVVDIDGYGEDGLDQVTALHARLPRCPVVVLTGCRKPGIVRQTLSAHASGLVTKDAAPRDLADSIRTVVRGEPVVDPQLAMAALTSIANPLTTREREILQIAAEGATPGEIAGRLYLSPGTVRNRLAAIIRKTGARTRVDAIRIAGDAGWLADSRSSIQPVCRQPIGGHHLANALTFPNASPRIGVSRLI
jgi:two-component system response regulator DesR